MAQLYPNFKRFFNSFSPKEVSIIEAQANDPHEIMTLGICLDGLDNCPIQKIGDYNFSDIVDELDSYLAKLKDVVRDAGKYDDDIVNAITDSNNKYNALAQAFSAAFAIFDNTKIDKFEEGWLTGNTWSAELSKFRLKNDPEYNSSDIILKDGNTYIGVSLKKANKVDQSPTLINYNLSPLIKKREEFVDIADQLTDELNAAIDEFFVATLNSDDLAPYVSREVTLDNWQKEMKNIRAIKKTDRKTYDEIEKTFNRELKGKNSPLRAVDKVLQENVDLFIKVLVDLVFKGKLLDFEELGFKFALVLGVGDTTKNTFRVKKGLYHAQRTLITAVDKLVDNKDKVTLVRDDDTKFDFDKGMTRSKLVYNMMAGDMPILRVEIRYKGLDTYSRLPIFQVYMTDEFIDYIEGENGTTQKDLGEEQASVEPETIALVPGSYKPPHKAHYDMVKQYSKIADKVIVLISDPKKQLRLTSTGRPITAEMSKKIWDIYVKAGKLDNVEVVISSSPSPVKAAYGYVLDKVPDGSTVIFGASTKDDDWKRWKNAVQYFETNKPGITVENPEDTAVDAIEGISASDIRKNIEDNELVKKYLPDELSTLDIKNVLGILRG